MNTVVVEIPNYTDNTKKSKKENIENTIKKYSSSNKVLSNYSKFILITKINSDNTENYFYNINVYDLPSMVEDEEESKIYLDFVEFTKESLGSSSTSSSSNTTSTVKGEDIELTAGNYVVGEDIKPGKYDIIALSGSGNLYIPQKVNEVMGTTDNNFYLKNYNNVTLNNGETLEISGRLKVKLQAK